MKGLLGRKIGMTQVYDSEGRVVPVTVLSVGPCTVVKVRTTDKNGYAAVELGFGDPPKKQNRPRKGAFEKAASPARRIVREFALPSDAEGKGFASGQELTVAGVFEGVKKVSV